MKKILCLFFFSLLSSLSSAQNKQEDELSIRSLITDQYLEGWMTGDTAKIGYAMHNTCHLKFYRDGQFTDVSREEYLGRFKPRQKDSTTVGRIIFLDITRNIANAKCEIETSKTTFTDYFNIIKVGSEWKIVDKISTRIDK